MVSVDVKHHVYLRHSLHSQTSAYEVFFFFFLPNVWKSEGGLHYLTETVFLILIILRNSVSKIFLTREGKKKEEQRRAVGSGDESERGKEEERGGGGEGETEREGVEKRGERG